MNETIIFLDIDGVLATNKQYNLNAGNFMRKNEWASKLNVKYPFDKGCVDIFNEILTTTGAEIVLSSDWKYYYTLDQLDIIFKENGVIKSPFDVTTNNMVSMSYLEKNRAYQIKTYITNNNIVKYAIIDDLNLLNFYDSVENNFIRTYNSEGLKQLGIKDKIIKLLT